jgi:hypothetical protein
MSMAWKHTFAAIIATVAFGLGSLVLFAMGSFAGMASAVTAVLFWCWAAAVAVAAVAPWFFGANRSRLRLVAAFAVASAIVGVFLAVFAEGGGDVALGLAALLGIGAAATERLARLASSIERSSAH